MQMNAQYQIIIILPGYFSMKELCNKFSDKKSMYYKEKINSKSQTFPAERVIY